MITLKKQVNQITVLTVKGKPKFQVSLNDSANAIDKLVLQEYGRQADNLPHNWRGDIVSI